jgi:hypothetical protein
MQGFRLVYVLVDERVAEFQPGDDRMHREAARLRSFGADVRDFHWRLYYSCPEVTQRLYQTLPRARADEAYLSRYGFRTRIVPIR